MLKQHRTLSAAACKLRLTNQWAKTNIKFEDEDLSLVLDYRIGDNPWKRLKYEQAKEALPKTAEVGLQEATATEFAQLIDKPSTVAHAVPLGGNTQ